MGSQEKRTKEATRLPAKAREGNIRSTKSGKKRKKQNKEPTQR